MKEDTLVRVLQLASPSLPVGGFSYSQGLEYAVECGWVTDAQSLRDWICSLLFDSVTHLEIPLLTRMIRAVDEGDEVSFSRWVDFLLASRETREFRDEEKSRGRAMDQVLAALSLNVEAAFHDSVRRSQLAGIAWAAARWRIPAEHMATAYCFSWLENTVTAGVKLVPLGQSDGQRLVCEIGALLPSRVAIGLSVDDPDIGGSSPAQAISSSLHETQYTRLYRS